MSLEFQPIVIFPPWWPVLQTLGLFSQLPLLHKPLPEIRFSMSLYFFVSLVEPRLTLPKNSNMKLGLQPEIAEEKKQKQKINSCILCLYGCYFKVQALRKLICIINKNYLFCTEYSVRMQVKYEHFEQVFTWGYS